MKMDEEELNKELANLARQALPELPDTLKADIWKSIRTRSTHLRERRSDELIGTFLRPQWAALALAITVAIGASFGRASADTEAREAHSSLGLDVFAGNAPTLPSTLLTRTR
jgi:hypothetical protein